MLVADEILNCCGEKLSFDDEGYLLFGKPTWSIWGNYRNYLGRIRWDIGTNQFNFYPVDMKYTYKELLMITNFICSKNT